MLISGQLLRTMSVYHRSARFFFCCKPRQRDQVKLSSDVNLRESTCVPVTAENATDLLKRDIILLSTRIWRSLYSVPAPTSPPVVSSCFEFQVQWDLGMQQREQQNGWRRPWSTSQGQQKTGSEIFQDFLGVSERREWYKMGIKLGAESLVNVGLYLFSEQASRLLCPIFYYFYFPQCEVSPVLRLRDVE